MRIIRNCQASIQEETGTRLYSLFDMTHFIHILFRFCFHLIYNERAQFDEESVN